MVGFGILIGKCFVSPTSPQIALMVIGWLFGVMPGWTAENYKSSLLAAGMSPESIEFLEDKCFADWPNEREWENMIHPGQKEAGQ